MPTFSGLIGRQARREECAHCNLGLDAITISEPNGLRLKQSGATNSEEWSSAHEEPYESSDEDSLFGWSSDTEPERRGSQEKEAVPRSKISEKSNTFTITVPIPWRSSRRSRSQSRASPNKHRGRAGQSSSLTRSKPAYTGRCHRRDKSRSGANSHHQAQPQTTQPGHEISVPTISVNPAMLPLLPGKETINMIGAAARTQDHNATPNALANLVATPSHSLEAARPAMSVLSAISETRAVDLTRQKYRVQHGSNGSVSSTFTDTCSHGHRLHAKPLAAALSSHPPSFSSSTSASPQLSSAGSLNAPSVYSVQSMTDDFSTRLQPVKPPQISTTAPRFPAGLSPLITQPSPVTSVGSTCSPPLEATACMRPSSRAHHRRGASTTTPDLQVSVSPHDRHIASDLLWAPRQVFNSNDGPHAQVGGNIYDEIRGDMRYVGREVSVEAATAHKPNFKEKLVQRKRSVSLAYSQTLHKHHRKTSHAGSRQTGHERADGAGAIYAPRTDTTKYDQDLVPSYEDLWA